MRKINKDFNKVPASLNVKDKKIAQIRREIIKNKEYTEKYDNFYKPEEANKDFFASVLFETSKANLLDSDEIIFYLIGGSTRAMMESNLCYMANLIAEDDITQEQTNYKVIDLKNALDISGFECYMQTLGYTKIH